LKQKLKLLQILRGFAAWMVVYYHYMQIFHGFQSQSFVGDFFSSHGMLGVDLFFVLSGFIMCKCVVDKKCQPFEFFLKRLLRITPTYWFYTLLTVLIIEIFNERYLLSSYDGHTLFLSLFYISSENPSGTGCFPTLTVGWTLNFEMLFYALLSTCILVARARAIYLCSFLLLIFPLLPSATDECHCIWARGDLLFEFVLGMALYKICLWSGKIPKNANLYICITLLLLSLVLFPHTGEYLKAKLLFCTATVGFFALFERHLKQDNWAVSKLSLLGDVSYSTYLCHVPILSVSNLLLPEIDNSTTELTTICLLSILILLTSWLSFMAIESNRSIIRLRNFIIHKTSKTS
jgi:exopolysaccharide production protein ExoZ